MSDEALRGASRTAAIAAVEALTGHIPYRWQQRLLVDWFLAGRVPDEIDVPTGLGKTRVMALWLVARGMGAPLPRRLIYVVDRRAVVDQATAEADALASHLPGLLGGLGEDAAIWRDRLGLKSDSLPVSTLRGQFTDNRRWLESVAGAAVVVGTVDMIGSRLLFEGYGIGAGMRPAHAAMLGADSLILIDEAHLVAPFEALLRSARMQPRPAPVPPMHVLSLSATGTDSASGEVFRLGAEDLDDPPVRARLQASKRLRLEEVDDLTKALADRAFALGSGGKRVLVFCNSRDQQARQVEKLLRERSTRDFGALPTTALLVGARRVLERERLTGRLDRDGGWMIEPDPVFRRFMAGAPEVEDGPPAFLIATSAGEVGVDLDADHMVCDLVAWERMVQRLGRVNRSGRPDAAIVDVFWTRVTARALKEDAEDELDARLAVMRAPFESPIWTSGADSRRDAGPGVLSALKDDPAFAALAKSATSTPPLRPPLTGPVLASWAMTSLDEHPGRPRIEPWLRGWIDTRPQTRVAWRRVMPVRATGRADITLLGDFFAELPPHLTEILEFDTALVVKVLKARASHVHSRFNDEGATLALVVLGSRRELIDAVSLDRLVDCESRRLETLLRERTVIANARLGGLSPEGLLDEKHDDPVVTYDAESAPADLAAGWSEVILQSVGRRLREVNLSDPPLYGWVRQAGWPKSIDEDDDSSRAEWRVERLAKAPEAGDAARASRAQALNEHHDWAREEAASIAISLGLTPEHKMMLEVAARVHDTGKERDLWQTAMGADLLGRPYAKTTGAGAVLALLEGYRHEFGSLKDADAQFDLIKDEDLRDLARHLVAAHHGFARPIIRPFDPNEPPSASKARAGQVALRFARLQSRWGPWGLAWWELLLRSADWAASARLSAGGDK
jgi:CRISPR-associated endonuclease/helicase Cas3